MWVTFDSYVGMVYAR